MALIIDITDERGITTGYHIISEYRFTGDKIEVKLRSYKDKSIREEEKEIIRHNEQVDKFFRDYEGLKEELLQISGDETKADRINDITDQINKMTNQGMPHYLPISKKYYEERVIEVPPIEPNSRELLYKEVVAKELANPFKNANKE